MTFLGLLIVIFAIMYIRKNNNADNYDDTTSYGCMVNGYCEYTEAFTKKEAYEYFSYLDPSVRESDVFEN